MRLIDAMVGEPLGGAPCRRDGDGDAVQAALFEFSELAGLALTARRREKYLAMGREGLA